MRPSAKFCARAGVPSPVAGAAQDDAQQQRAGESITLD
jgi:hypothetical protein